MILTEKNEGKTVFYSIQYKNGNLPGFELFHMFTQSIKFYHRTIIVLYIPLSHIKERRCWKKVSHQIDSKNVWVIFSASCTAKFELVFVLTLENVFCQRFHYKANIKSIGSSEKRYRDFQNSTPLERSACS